MAPWLRLLKVLRFMPNFSLLTQAMVLVGEAMPTLLIVMVILMWSFASLLCLFEPFDNLQSLPHALWMTVVTMTTVGYGDVYPMTIGGYCTCSLLAVMSLLYMAMPLSIIGSIFTNVWEDRDRIMLMKKTRTRLAQWGFTVEDIPALFMKFDNSGSGEIDLAAFLDMIQSMD